MRGMPAVPLTGSNAFESRELNKTVQLTVSAVLVLVITERLHGHHAQEQAWYGRSRPRKTTRALNWARRCGTPVRFSRCRQRLEHLRFERWPTETGKCMPAPIDQDRRHHSPHAADTDC